MLNKFKVKYFFSLHPYLEKNLNKLKLFPLTPLQNKVLSLSDQQSNIFINENTGSGKTLCYLVPLMNNILNKKRQNNTQPWGGLVLTITKELCIQIYRQIRLLDPENLIKVSRIGSISHFSSIVQKLNKRQTVSQNIDELMKENVVNTINWNNWDIMISTPHALLNAVNKKTNLIRPKTVIIDQADLLLARDQNLAKVTKNLIKKYITQPHKLQYILAASSFPPKIEGIQSKLALKTMFKNISIIESETKHRLPPTLQVQFIDTTIFTTETKIGVLLDILSSGVQGKTIIFCNSGQGAEQLSKDIKMKGKKCQFLAALLNSHQRSEVISKFETGQIQILVTTNLGSRGLDLDVGQVIQFEMATNAVDYLNRAGRTARFGKPGRIISFIQNGDMLLFESIKKKLQSGEAMDEVFSRKRSFSKIIKKVEAGQEKQEQEQQSNK